MKVLIFSLLIAVVACSEINPTCFTAGLTDGSCDWYKDCLQVAYDCPATGYNAYPLGYGYFYCSKFMTNISLYPPQAQEWIENTLVCLKVALKEPFYDKAALGDDISCATLTNEAFSSHPECYVQSGFCQLWTEQSLEDRVKTAWALHDTYDLSTFMNVRSVKQVVETLENCVENGVDRDLIDPIIHILEGDSE
mmetsp:Transcript_10944/g.11981  ORF Transcript_10944/g.11981 Transcript_10944/m.11981 type:complete len:194 (+) Transcript_10944:418-999(+)